MGVAGFLTDPWHPWVCRRVWVTEGMLREACSAAEEEVIVHVAKGGPELAWVLPARLHSHLGWGRLQSGVYWCLHATEDQCRWLAFLPDMTRCTLQ